jgi:hypothetical protein
MSNINGLFGKFDSIKINNSTRISKEDEEYCKMHNEAYISTLKCYKGILDNLISLYNEQITNLYDYNGQRIESYSIYVSVYGDFGVNKMIKEIIKVKETFISKICWYFNRKYNVSIKPETIYEKYKDIEAPYERKEKKDKTLNTNLIEYK